jgi:IclR family transcriptional regulator, pca regulon regulatory protein
LNVCCPSARITPEDMRTRVLAETLEASTKITGALAS